MTVLMMYSTALLLGTVHALEADHMAAVTAFAVRRPGVREAVGFGVRWSAGHGGAIVLAGAGLILLGIHVPAAATGTLEHVVGLVMIGLGVWTFRGAHDREPAHHHGVHGHGRRRAVSAVGLLHGLAGSGSVVALVPLAGLQSRTGGILYLVVFAVGTVAAMALYGLFAGLVVGRADGSVRFAPLLARGTGIITVAIGLVWLFR
jgi:nickel/cobalt transporter (NicO) family protein